MRGRTGVIATLVLATAAAGCGASGDDGAERGGDGDVASVALAGTTEQGMRMRVEPVGDDRVRLRLPVDCGDDPDGDGHGGEVSLHRHPVEAELAGDGSFRAEVDYVEDGVDGSDERVEGVVEGAYADDGTASGTFEVTARWWEGQAETLSGPCESGTVGWSATEPLVVPEPVLLPAAVTQQVADGAELVVRTEAGDVLRVGPDGSLRRLDGTAVEAAAPTPTTLGDTPPTVAAPTGSPDMPAGVGVVADGLWAPDAGGGLVRHELADGQVTGHVEPRTDAAIDSVATGHDALWTVARRYWQGDHTLEKRDPQTGAVVATAPVLDGEPFTGPTDLWYFNATLAGERLDRIDPTTLRTEASLEIDVRLPVDAAVVRTDRAWALTWEGLVTLDLATGRRTPVDLVTTPDGLTAAATDGEGDDGEEAGVWTVHQREAVARLLVGDEVAATVDVPDGWWQPTGAADGDLWLAGTADGQARLVHVASPDESAEPADDPSPPAQPG